MLPIVALSVRQMGGSVALAALVVTLYAFGSIATTLPASLLTHRHGERRMLPLSLVWGALGLGLCALTSAVAPSLLPFAAGVVMFGMAQAVVNLARMSWLTGAVPFHLRARAFSLMGGATRLGLFIGPFLAAVAIRSSGLWAAYAVGVAAMAVAALAAARLPVLPGDAPAGRSAQPAPRLTAMAVTHRRIFATVGIGVLCVSAVRSARSVVIPLWADHLGLDAATASVIFGLASAVDLLVFYPAGKFMDTRGRRSVAIPSMTIMGLALVLVPFTGGATSLLLASLMLGIGNGISSGLIMVLGADHAPVAGRAQFLGFWRLIADIGTSAGPALLSAATAFAGSLAAGVWATSLTGFGAAFLLARHVPRTLRSIAERQETASR